MAEPRRKHETQAETAKRIGVDVEEYRRWCAGFKGLDHIRAAVLAAEKKAE